LPLLLFLGFHRFVGIPAPASLSINLYTLAMKNFVWNFLRLRGILKEPKCFAVYEYHSSISSVSSHVHSCSTANPNIPWWSNIRGSLAQTHGTPTNERLGRINGTVMKMQFHFDNIIFYKEQDNICITDFSLMTNYWCECHLSLTLISPYFAV
jgi:hypothetical protein